MTDIIQGFLYSGTLNAELETLAEVAIIADKYQVLDLAMHCVLALTVIHVKMGFSVAPFLAS